MAVKWKPSATAFCVLCCFLIILSNAFVNGVRVQSKRVKAAPAKGKCVWHSSQSIIHPSKITAHISRKSFFCPHRIDPIRLIIDGETNTIAHCVGNEIETFPSWSRIGSILFDQFSIRKFDFFHSILWKEMWKIDEIQFDSLFISNKWI